MQKNTVPLKYLSILWRTHEISLINCDINLILTWPTNCVIAGVSRITKITTFQRDDYIVYYFVAISVNIIR